MAVQRPGHRHGIQDVMGLTKTVQLHRGIAMYPVYDIRLSNTHLITYSVNTLGNPAILSAVVKDEVVDWMTSQNLPDDPFGHEWDVWADWENETSNFFFRDPALALLFKLTWA